MIWAFLAAAALCCVLAHLASFHRARADFWHKAFLGQHESHMAFLREQQARQPERSAALEEWRRRQYEGMQNAIRRDWN